MFLASDPLKDIINLPLSKIGLNSEQNIIIFMTHFTRSNALNNCLNISFVDMRAIRRKVNDIETRDTKSLPTHTHTHTLSK